MNRKTSLKRIAVFAAAAVMLLATTAFAVGKIQSTVSHSSRDEAFTQMPTSSEMKKLLNVSPKLIEQFDNGYQFEEGLVAHSEDMDDSGNVVSKYKMLDLSYVNGADSVWLSIEQQKAGRTLPDNASESVYGDVKLYALAYTLKTVPLDYVKTEQDLRDEAAGKVYFGTMGDDTIAADTVQMLFWDDGGVSYSLLTRNSPLISDELAAMAKQIINQK